MCLNAHFLALSQSDIVNFPFDGICSPPLLKINYIDCILMDHFLVVLSCKVKISCELTLEVGADVMF